MSDIKCDSFYGKEISIPKEKIVFRPAAYAILVQDNKILLMTMRRTGKLASGLSKGEHTSPRNMWS